MEGLTVNNLELYRQYKNWSIDELAKHMNLSINRTKELCRYTLVSDYKMARKLNISLEDFIQPVKPNEIKKIKVKKSGINNIIDNIYNYYNSGTALWEFNKLFDYSKLIQCNSIENINNKKMFDQNIIKLNICLMQSKLIESK
jgi:transcriptional regulator with XRE-family HTH domain